MRRRRARGRRGRPGRRRRRPGAHRWGRRRRRSVARWGWRALVPERRLARERRSLARRRSDVGHRIALRAVLGARLTIRVDASQQAEAREQQRREHGRPSHGNHNSPWGQAACHRSIPPWSRVPRDLHYARARPNARCRAKATRPRFTIAAPLAWILADRAKREEVPCLLHPRRHNAPHGDAR